MPRSKPMASWNGSVMRNVAARMPPAMSPKVRTIFRMGFSCEGGCDGGTPGVCARAARSRVIRTGDSRAGAAEITLSGDDPRLFRALYGLRPPLRRELVEQPGGMRLHSVLAHEQPLGDLPSAEPSRHRLEDLEFPRRDPELLEPRLIPPERSRAGHAALNPPS